MQKWEISSLQAGMLVAGVVSITGHGLAVTQMFKVGGRDAWMSGLFGLPIAALAVWSMVKLGRIFPGKTIVEYVPKILGYAGYPVSLVYVLYYLLAVFFTLRMTTDWLVDSLLPETPSWVMGAVFMASVLFAAVRGLDVLARINQFTLPLLTLLGLVVSTGTLQAKDYGLLRPFFEHGFGPVFRVSILGLGYYGEMCILAMFHAYVRPQDRPSTLKAYMWALLFLAFTLTGPLMGSMATLGYRVAQNMAYPTFQHWLMVSLARFFERTDLLAVHQWLAGAYVRSALFLLMGVKGGLQLLGGRVKKTNWFLSGMALALLVASELLFPNKPRFDNFIAWVYLPGWALLGVLLPPVLLTIAWVRGMARTGTGITHGA